MLKKRKHKMKRRNTEPQMVLPLVPVANPNPAVPNSAPPTGSNPGQGYAGRAPNLADLCDSPSHATAV